MNESLKKQSENVYQMSRDNNGFFKTKKWIVNTFDGSLEQYDKREFIIYQLKNYPARYCLDLFMCLGDFWIKFSKNDFEYVFENLEHPKLGLSFIEFIYICLGINSLEIIFHSKLTLKNKLIYFQYYKSYFTKLFQRFNRDEELLKTDMDVSLNDLDRIGDQIKKEDDSLKSSFYKTNKIRNYIKRMFYCLKIKTFLRFT